MSYSFDDHRDDDHWNADERCDCGDVAEDEEDQGSEFHFFLLFANGTLEGPGIFPHPPHKADGGEGKSSTPREHPNQSTLPYRPNPPHRIHADPIPRRGEEEPIHPTNTEPTTNDARKKDQVAGPDRITSAVGEGGHTQIADRWYLYEGTLSRTEHVFKLPYHSGNTTLPRIPSRGTPDEREVG